MSKTKKKRTTELAVDASAVACNLAEIDQACKDIEDEASVMARKKRGKGSRSGKIKCDNMNNKGEVASVHMERKEAPTLQAAKDTIENGQEVIKEKGEDWIMKAVTVVIEHLNKFGACVIDDFLGEAKGLKILEEVLSLRKHETFQEGQLASSINTEKSIRSDKIIWTDGVKPPSPNLKYLITTLDTLVITANKSQNNGVLSNYQISGRTKAMVACYPGEGTHYVKHVDNPNKDGRCITAIYYLNRDWHTEVDGGVLKIYSACVEGVVAKVDPIFDRIIFFWSDRRNPHEVLPAFRERYAVTVWYMDETEKRIFDNKKKLNTKPDEI